jgi:hypothetical protein
MNCKTCKKHLATYAKTHSCRLEYCKLCVPTELVVQTNSAAEISMETSKMYYIDTLKSKWQGCFGKALLMNNFSKHYLIESCGVCCWHHKYIHMYEKDFSIILEWGQKIELHTECVFLHRVLKSKIFYIFITISIYENAGYADIYRLARNIIKDYMSSTNSADNDVTICEIVA